MKLKELKKLIREELDISNKKAFDRKNIQIIKKRVLNALSELCPDVYFKFPPLSSYSRKKTSYSKGDVFTLYLYGEIQSDDPKYKDHSFYYNLVKDLNSQYFPELKLQRSPGGVIEDNMVNLIIVGEKKE